jgi:hypothetical protein
MTNEYASSSAFAILKSLSDIDDKWVDIRTVAARFESYRRRPDGTIVQVAIEVLDNGPESDARWSVEARAVDGAFATGNPNEDLHVAMNLVHWHDLDKPPASA